MIWKLFKSILLLRLNGIVSQSVCKIEFCSNIYNFILKIVHLLCQKLSYNLLFY